MSVYHPAIRDPVSQTFVFLTTSWLSTTFASSRHKKQLSLEHPCSRWDCPKGQEPTQRMFRRQHLNWAAKFCTNVLIPKGKTNTPVAFPSQDIRRGVNWEKRHRASLRDRGHPAGADLTAAPRSAAWTLLFDKQARSPQAPAGCRLKPGWQPAPGPGQGLRLAARALPEQGLSQPLAPPPQRSAECQPVILPCCSRPLRAKLPTFCFAVCRRYVAQGWIWPKFDLFIFPVLCRVLKP